MVYRQLKAQPVKQTITYFLMPADRMAVFLVEI
jgi:hypothetical protein